MKAQVRGRGCPTAHVRTQLRCFLLVDINGPHQSCTGRKQRLVQQHNRTPLPPSTPAKRCHPPSRRLHCHHHPPTAVSLQAKAKINKPFVSTGRTGRGIVPMPYTATSGPDAKDGSRSQSAPPDSSRKAWKQSSPPQKGRGYGCISKLVYVPCPETPTQVRRVAMCPAQRPQQLRPRRADTLLCSPAPVGGSALAHLDACGSPACWRQVRGRAPKVDVARG